MKKYRKTAKRLLSVLLSASMLAPSTGQLLAYGAEAVQNMPRYVDFSRPKALTLGDLGLEMEDGESTDKASSSQAGKGSGTAGSGTDGSRTQTASGGQTDSSETDAGGTAGGSSSDAADTSSVILATASNALASDSDALRSPEFFYDLEIDEPEGELIELEAGYRTYLTGEGEYTTIIGGYSGLYKDEDGEIQEIDNTLTWEDSQTNEKRMERGLAPEAYQNTAGDVEIEIPSQIKSGKGIILRNGSKRLMLIPQGGDFRKSAVEENAIRYNDVFEDIDYQYTVLGDTVKEDILLLSDTGRHEFSYRVYASGLKTAVENNTVLFYSSQKARPEFVITAPIMIDANGETSMDLTMEAEETGSGCLITVTADEEWLGDEERAYPVRIDPGPVVKVPSEFIMVQVASGAPDKFLGWSGPMYVGYDEEWKDRRVYIAINGDWTQIIGQAACVSATFTVTAMTANGQGKTQVRLCAPESDKAPGAADLDKWDANQLTWNKIQNLNPPIVGNSQVISEPNQKLEYDITDLMNCWMALESAQVGLALRADVEYHDKTDEALLMPAEAFYNIDDPINGPTIVINWGGSAELEGLENFPVADSTARITPSVEATDVGGRDTHAVALHGLTQAEADISWQLQEGMEGDNGEIEFTDVEGMDGSCVGSAEYEYVDTTFDGLFPEVLEEAKTSNWQEEDPFRPDEEIMTDTIYRFHVEFSGQPVTDENGEPVDGGEETEKELDTDSFLIYPVKKDDLAKRIARHYGVDPNELGRDNHLYQNQLTVEGTYLFIRNPETDEPYTAEELTVDEQMLLDALHLGMDPYCMLQLEPINMNTGNFYMNQTDAALEDLGGSFAIERSYNSRIPNHRSEFGMGWNSPWGEHLTVLSDGRILYTEGDGAWIPFTAGEDGQYAGPDGYDLTLETVDSIDLEGEMDVEETDEEDADGEDADAPALAPANAALSLDGDSQLDSEPGIADSEEDTEDSRNEDEYYVNFHSNFTTFAEDFALANGKTKNDQKASASNASRRSVSRLAAAAPKEQAGEDAAEETAESAAASANSKAQETDGEESAVQAVPAAVGWKLTSRDGTARYFDGAGILRYREDRRGNRTSFIYDADYTLTQIQSPSDKCFAITMDEEGKITAIGLPDGGEILYGYDENQNLVSVTNPEGGVRRYVYDDAHHMTAWYDEDGNQVVENVYDENGRVTAQTDAEGHTAYLEYGDGVTIMTDNRGNETRYTYDEQGRGTGVTYADGTTTSTEYDGEGRIAQTTDELGMTTSYTYDDQGNVLTETRDDGSRMSYGDYCWDQPGTITDYEGNTTVVTYDEQGNALTVTDGEGNTTFFTYDEAGRMLSMTDANGAEYRFVYDGAAVTSITDGEGGRWNYTYDAMNRLLSETDPEGNTHTFSYNRNGWTLAETDGNGNRTVYDYSPSGNVLSIVDPNGSETAFTYDRMHNILTGEDPLGNVLTYTYDENYNRIGETDAAGNHTQYQYDERDRITRIVDSLGNAVSLTLDGLGQVTEMTDRRGNTARTEYDPILGLPVREYDQMGNETSYTYDRNGNLLSITYPGGSSQSYVYDRAGNLISVTAQNGLVTELAYDGTGNIVRITDDESRVYTFTYDGNNRLVKTEDPLGGMIRYTYDGAGNLLRQTDANGNPLSFGYDGAGRLTEILDALEGRISLAYDGNGNLLTQTDQNGHTSEYRYDAVGQLLVSTDAEGNLTAAEYDAVGNATKLTDALKGETICEYDSLGRTVTVQDAMGGRYAYTYDENRNMTGIRYPDGDTVSMTYDANNQMTSYTDEAGVITTYTYDSLGRIIRAEDNIGNTMDYAYDVSGNLVKQTDTIGREAIYQYDQFNRLVSVTGTDGAETKYAYDPLDRLISVTQADGTVTAYEYDAAGNLTRMTEPGEAVYTYAYDAINRVTEEVNPVGAATAFQYDAKGNLTAATDGEGNTTAYTYDAIDRLTRYTDGRGNDTLYEYDELSRLLSYTTPEGSREEYRYDALGNLTKAKDANGLITEYRYDVMGNLLEAISPKGAKTAYTYDKHDELTSVTDPAGNVTAYTVDLNRQVTKLTQKNGGEYTYEYDAVHRLTGITTPLGLSVTLQYDDADNITRQSDSLGRTNTYQYDIMHRLTQSVNAEGGVFTYGYDIRGNQNSVTDALGYTWNYTYDLVDQLTKSVDPEGKATEAVYNLVGQIQSITRPGERTTQYAYDGNYNTTAVTDPMGYVYGYTYDKDNRGTGTANPLGETESYTYDAGSRLTAFTDRMGLTESYEYDPHGNVLAVTATDGLVTRFAYDILDNLVKVTLPSGLTSSYGYDVMGNVTSTTDTMKRTTTYTYDLEGNMTSLTDAMGRKETMTYDAAGRQTSYTSNGGNVIRYDYNKINNLVEKSYEDARDPEGKEGVLYGYDTMGQRVSMMDRSGESSYEYDGLGRITKVTTGSGETTTYQYGVNDLLETLTYPDGKSVHYEYDKNDNLTKVTDRTGAVTTYVYDAINRITEIHRPNGVSTYNTYNARDQIVTLKNICDDCGWVVSQYDYSYDDRGFIVGEDAVESLYGYAWDDKHDGKHENGRHDDQYPHGGQHTNKHDKDGEYNFQIVETERTFTYDADGKLLTATENEEQQGRYDYEFQYDDMGNRTYYGKSRNGTLQESGEYTYNAANQLTEAKIYDGKKHTTLTYEYDADGNRISETGKIGTDKVENTYIYTVENRLKAVYDADELLAAMAYDGDGNRIFQLNYNLHTDDDWKDNNGNGNGNNKDNTGSGNSSDASTANVSAAEASAAETEESQSIAQMLLNVLGLGGDEESTAAESEETATEEAEVEAVETAATAAADEQTSVAEESEEPAADAAQEDQLLSIFSGISELASEAQEEKSEVLSALEGITLPETESVPELEGIDIEVLSTDKANDNGNNGNNGNGGNGNHYGWDKASDSNAGNSGNNGNGNGNSGNNGNGNGSSDNNGNANGNTNNTGGSQNQSGILFPETGQVSELEQEMIDMIKTEGKEKNYELIEYVNDVNREYTEVLMELNINGIMDTAYSYGNKRLTVERFDGWTGYYTYDPRGSVSGVTGADGYLWQSYRYDAYGNITFGAPQYNNEYTYNAESYNPNLDVQYLRARYYSPSTANFLTEDSYLGDISDPLTLNRYNYVKSSPLNYVDPSGHIPDDLALANRKNINAEPENVLDQFVSDLRAQVYKALIDVYYGDDNALRLKLGPIYILMVLTAKEWSECEIEQITESLTSFALGAISECLYYVYSMSSKSYLDELKKNLVWKCFIEQKEEAFVRENLDWYAYYEGKTFIDDAYASVGNSLLTLLMLLPEVLISGITNGAQGAGMVTSAAVTESGKVMSIVTRTTAGAAGATAVAIPILVVGGVVLVQGSLMQMKGESRGDTNREKAKKDSKPTPEELAEKVPDKYKENFKCDQFADEMEKLMKESGVSGEKISVQSKTDYIWSDKYGVISENGRHYAIKVGDTVFDNLNPQGISYSDWLSDLGISDLPSMFDVTTSLIN